MEKSLFTDGANAVLLVSGSADLYEKILSCLHTSDILLSAVPPTVDAGINEKSKPTSIFVKDRDYFRRIDFEQIRWIEASGSYCCLHLLKAPKLLLSFNLSELSSRLPSDLFLRVHRSYIVNVNFIDSFIGNMLCIGEDRIAVSKQHKKDVITRLNILGNTK